MSTRRATRRVREPPLRQRDLWKQLKQCVPDEVPRILENSFVRITFTASAKGELSAWLEGISKCDAWLKKWLDQNGKRLDLTHAFIEETTTSVSIPNAINDRDVLRVLSFLSCLLEHSRNKAVFSAVHTVSLFLNSPSVDIVQETLIVLHWFAGSQRQRHQQVPFDKSLQHKLITIAAGWGSSPSLLQSVGLEERVPQEEADIDNLQAQFYTQTYNSAKPYEVSLEGLLPQAKNWYSASMDESSRLSITCHMRKCLSDTEGGPIVDRPRGLVEYIMRAERLPFKHAYPLWTILRMSSAKDNNELCSWAVCRLLALAVLASTNDEMLRNFLQPCSDWFQDVVKVLSNDKASPVVLKAVLQLLCVLLSNSAAKEALSNADLRGSTLSPSTLVTSQGRLLDILRSAPHGMTQPEHLDENGHLRVDSQSMYTALFAFAFSFAVNQHQAQGVRTLNTAIIVPFLEVPRLRVPGTEKVAAKCLGVLEALLSQDVLREQIIDTGVTDLLIDLLHEDVMLVDTETPLDPNAEPAKHAPPNPTAEEKMEDTRYKLDAQRRLSYEREVVVTHILKAFLHCIGTAQAQPVTLFANNKLRESLKIILSNPVHFGQPTYKFTASVISKLMNTDHIAVCPAAVEAGFLEISLDVLKNPPADPRYALVLPQIIVASSLCHKGIEIMKNSKFFQPLIENIVSGDSWFSLTTSDAATLGVELSEIIRQVKPLLEECANTVAGSLLNAIAKVEEWEPKDGNDNSAETTRPLHVLHNHILILDPLQRLIYEKTAVLKVKAIIRLLQVSERVCSFFYRHSVSLEPRSGLKKLLPICTELRTDLLYNLSHISALREVLICGLFPLLNSVANQLCDNCADVEKWEVPISVAATVPAKGSALVLTEWPLKEGEELLPLHRVASVAHVLSLVVTLETRKPDIRLSFLRDSSVEPLNSFKTITNIVELAVSILKWKVVREVDKQNSFGGYTVVDVPKNSSSSSAVDDRTGNVVFHAATAAAIATLTTAEADDGIADIIMIRRQRVATAYCDSCCSVVDLLCKAAVVTFEPFPKTVASQLSNIALQLVTCVNEELQKNTSLSTVAALFNEMILGSWFTKILRQVFDSSLKKFKDACPIQVLRFFEKQQGVELLADTCSTLIIRYIEEFETIDADKSHKSSIETAAIGAVRLLERFSNVSYIEGAARGIPGVLSRDSLSPSDLARKLQNVIAVRVSSIYKHKNLSDHPALAMEVIATVGQIVKDCSWLQNMNGKSKQKEEKKSSGGFKPSEDTVDQLVGMGFTRGIVRRALSTIGQNSVQHGAEWILSHMDEIGDEDEEEEEEEDQPEEGDNSTMAKAIAMSLDGDEPNESAAPDAASSLAQSCQNIALKLGTTPDVTYCATDLLSLVAEADSSQQKQILDQIVEGISSSCPDTRQRSYSQLHLILSQNSMHAQRQSLCQNESLISVIGNQLRELAKQEVSSEGFDKYVELLSSSVGAIDGLTQSTPAEERDNPSPRGLKSPKHVDANATSDSNTEWEILLASVTEQSHLSSDSGSLIISSLCDVVVKKWEKPLPTKLVYIIVVILERLCKEHHYHTETVYNSGTLEKLIASPAQGKWPNKSIASNIASLVRTTIEDDDYVRSVQESAIRKVFGKITAEQENQAPGGAVEFINADVLQQPNQQEDKLEGKQDKSEKKKKRLAAKKAEIPVSAASPKKKPIPLVKLQSLMQSLDGVKKKNPASFLQAFAACCRLVVQPKEGDKKNYLVELCPAKEGPSKQRRQSTRRKAAVVMVDEIQKLILASLHSRRDQVLEKNLTYALSTPQVLHLSGELITLFPSCLSCVLSNTHNDKTFLEYLLYDYLPYTYSPTYPDRREEATHAMLLSSTAKYVTLQMAAKQPEQVAPEIVNALQQSVKPDAKGLGGVHALCDMVVALLSRAAKSEKPTPHTSAPVVELLKSGIVNSICIVLRDLQLNHPDAQETTASILKIIPLVAEGQKRVDTIQDGAKNGEEDEEEEQHNQTVEDGEDAELSMNLDVEDEPLRHVIRIEGGGTTAIVEVEDEVDEAEEVEEDEEATYEEEGEEEMYQIEGHDDDDEEDDDDNYDVGDFELDEVQESEDEDPARWGEVLASNARQMFRQLLRPHGAANDMMAAVINTSGILPEVLSLLPSSHTLQPRRAQATNLLLTPPQQNNSYVTPPRSYQTLSLRPSETPARSQGGRSRLPVTSTVSYSAEAVESALGAFLRSNAPESIITLPERIESIEVEETAQTTPQPAGEVESPETPKATPTAAEEVPTEVAEVSNPVDDGQQQQQPATDDAIEEMDLQAQLELALGMSLMDAEGTPAAEPTTTPAPPTTAPAPAPPTPAPVSDNNTESNPIPSNTMDPDDELTRALALSLEGPSQGPVEAAEEGPVSPIVPSSPAPETPVQASGDVGGETAAPEAAPSAEPALDPTFVAALPEEIRREVLRENVHLLMTRTEPGEDGSTIDSTFLAALPNAIREEVMEFERRILERAAAEGGASAVETDMDPASFMATLPPELRQEILTTSDETFLNALPEEYAAEAQSLRYQGGLYYHQPMRTDFGTDNRRRQQQRKKVIKPVEDPLKPVKPLVGIPCITSFVRVLLMYQYTAKSSLGTQLNKALEAISAHPPTCRALYSLLLYILGNGDSDPPSEIEGAVMCIRPLLYGVPMYIANQEPAYPFKTPPIVTLRVIEVMSSLLPSRLPFLYTPSEHATDILSLPVDQLAGSREKVHEIVRSTVFFKLLQLHTTNVFSTSPKLNEALSKLVQRVCEELCSVADDEAMKQTTSILKDLKIERLSKIKQWSCTNENSLMEHFDFDCESTDSSEKLKIAFQKRSENQKLRGDFLRSIQRELLIQKATRLRTVEPTINQRLTSSIFAYPPTLSSLVELLEMPDTTATSVTNCLTTLNAMCAARLNYSKTSEDLGGESVARRLLQELLQVAERISRRATDYLNDRATRVGEALKTHMNEHGITLPTQQTTKKDSSTPSASTILPSAVHFFLADEPPSHEVQLQRLTRTLSCVSHHDQGLVKNYEEATLFPTQKQLQGTWRTAIGKAYVRHNYVVLGMLNGTLSGPRELEEKDGVLHLLGCKVELYGGRWCEWDDGDVWTRDDEDTVLKSYSKFKVFLEPLWSAVDRYLVEMGNILQALGDGYQTSPKVLPLVEAFLAFYEIDPLCKQCTKPLLPISPDTPLLTECSDLMSTPEARSKSHRLNKTASTTSMDEVDTDPVKRFIVTHRRLLNALIKTNPSLMTSSLRAMLGYSTHIDFSNKRNWFRERITKDHEEHHRRHTSIKVNRLNIFHDSFMQLRRQQTLKGGLRVTFKGEEGVDGGGLRREWFLVLAKEMFNPGYALFIPSEEGNTFQPNPHSSINIEHLSYFNFVGKVVGLAVYNDVMLDAYFTRSLYKHMLGIPPDFRDMQSIDQQYYESLEWILDNDITGVFEYYFCTEVDKFGVKETVELTENGRNIPVTEQNKREYIQHITDYRMTKNIKKQLTEFLKGFFEVVPRHLIQIFSPEELELLICGTSDVDIMDLKVCIIFLMFFIL